MASQNKTKLDNMIDDDLFAYNHWILSGVIQKGHKNAKYKI